MMARLASDFVKKNYNIKIIQYRPEAICYKLDENIEILNWHACDNKYLNLIFNTIKLYKYLKNNTDIIIAFLNPIIISVSIVSFFVKNKIVVSERCDPCKSPGNYLRRKIRDYCFKKADLCVFQTQDAREYFSFIEEKKCKIIPNAISDDIIKNNAVVRQNKIVFVGQIIPQKNVKMLIDGFAKFCRIDNRYTLEVYGQGYQLESMKAYTKNKDLNDKIRFHGFVNNVLTEIEDASVYVSTSDFEGISNSILEAMALGLPVIATDCPIGGSRMLIQNEENGVLIPMNDSQALCDALIKITSNPDFAHNLSKNAEKVKSIYAIEKISQMWLENIKKC